MANVRLSVIIASEGNKVRTSTHTDVPLRKVAQHAAKLAASMASFHDRTEKKENG